MSNDMFQQKSMTRTGGGHMKGIVISAIVIALLIAIAVGVAMWYKKKYHK